MSPRMPGSSTLETRHQPQSLPLAGVVVSRCDEETIFRYNDFQFRQGPCQAILKKIGPKPIALKRVAPNYKDIEESLRSLMATKTGSAK